MSHALRLAAVPLALIACASCCMQPGGRRRSRPAAAAAPDQREPDATAPYSWVRISPASGALASTVQAEVRKARALARKPVVYGGASWCPPCVAVKKFRGDARMADAFRGAYVIEVNIDRVKSDEAKSLGYAFGSIPVFIAVGDDARATGPKIDGGAWGDNIPKNMAPPLKAFFAKL